MSTAKYQLHTKLFLLIIYLVGVTGLSLPATRAFFQELTPLNLLVAASLLFLFHQPWQAKTVLLLLIIFVSGFLVEMAGVQTGVIFGQYHYGDSFGFKIAGTPVLIGLNWAMLVYMVYHLLYYMRGGLFLRSVAGALVMVAYDLLLEPVAIQLDFWNWAGNGIPLQNYFAWFVLSFIFLMLLEVGKIKTENRISNWLLGIQFMFFLILNITL